MAASSAAFAGAFVCFRLANLSCKRPFIGANGELRFAVFERSHRIMSHLLSDDDAARKRFTNANRK